MKKRYIIIILILIICVWALPKLNTSKGSVGFIPGDPTLMLLRTYAGIFKYKDVYGKIPNSLSDLRNIEDFPQDENKFIKNHFITNITDIEYTKNTDENQILLRYSKLNNHRFLVIWVVLGDGTVLKIR